MGDKGRKYSERIYNYMQENEIPMFFELMPQLVRSCLEVDRLWSGKGRPPLKLYDVLVCLMVKQYFNLSLRRSIGFLKLLKRAGIIDVEDIPCFKTLDNYLNQAVVQTYMQKLIDMTAAIFSEVEHHMATDSTGISTLTRSSWYEFRVCKKSKKKDYIMVHATVVIESNIVAALDIKIRPRQHTPFERELRCRCKNLSKAMAQD